MGLKSPAPGIHLNVKGRKLRDYHPDSPWGHPARPFEVLMGPGQAPYTPAL